MLQKLGRISSITQNSNRPDLPRTSISERPKNFLDGILTKKGKKVEQHVTLETILNIAQDYEHFDETILKQLSPKSIYTTGNDIGDIKLYTHYNESQISCLDEDHILLDVITKDSYQKIKLEKLRLMHLGLVIIGIKPSVRTGLDTKTLLVILELVSEQG